ncbi:MAG: hypothetical protein R2748_25780 [Bryobacterales bacterium]
MIGGIVDPRIRHAIAVTYYVVDGGDGENNLGYNAGCISTELLLFIAHLHLLSTAVPTGQNEELPLVRNVRDFLHHGLPGNILEREPPTRSAAFVARTRGNQSGGHVAIYNWGLEPEITVNISALGFSVGDKLRLPRAARTTLQRRRRVRRDRPSPGPDDLDATSASPGGSLRRGSPCKLFRSSGPS